MSLPKAILFDLDDTLLDYDSGAEGCWRAACELHVSALPGVTAEQLLAAIDGDVGNRGVAQSRTGTDGGSLSGGRGLRGSISGRLAAS